MLDKSQPFSISLPESICKLVDSLEENRSKYFKRLAVQDLEKQGVYGSSNKARIIAAIQSMEDDLSEDEARKLLKRLAKLERENLGKESFA